MSSYLTRVRKNRPDALGYWQDSQAKESKYADAIRRLVASLKVGAKAVDPEDVRGKRRMRGKPHDNNNTIRTYLKSIELFSYWMQASFGEELDPQFVTREVCMQFVEWLLSSDPPNITGLRVQAGGKTLYALYQAVERASKRYNGDWVNVIQIYEALNEVEAEIYKNVDGSWTKLHHDLNVLVRDYHSIMRDKSSVSIRRQTGIIWGKLERDALTYRYMIIERKRYATASASTYVSAMSAVFEEFLQGENYPGGEAPLQYNPWKGAHRSPRALLQRKMREEQKRKAMRPIISHALVDALLATTLGTDLESRRNRALVTTLIFTGMRAEEVVGMQRKDLVLVDGVGNMRVIGKGDKARFIPMYGDIRDAYSQLDTVLEEIASVQSQDEETQYKAEYAKTLLTHPKAPVIPAVPRWGKNEREVAAEQAALEPLDTSGLRAIISKLTDRARVFDKRLGIVRALTNEEKRMIHPHALRHYAATAAQDAGLPMEEVKRILGHEDLRTTERYVHIAPKAVAQLGAYIAKARSGTVMTAEEAAQLQKVRGSVLSDPDIQAAPAEIPRQHPKPQTEEQKAAREEAKAAKVEASQPQAPQIVTSPTWVYENPSKEQWLLYLLPSDSPGSMDKGWGLSLSMRIGKSSRLPMWAGRANRLPAEQLIPIISPFQTFYSVTPEEEGGVSIVGKLVALYQKIRAEKGVTAATAYMVWLQEVLVTASSAFFSIMTQRQDKWIEFDQPALPIPKEGDPSADTQDAPLYHAVRMHPGDRIVGWFEKWGWQVKGSVVRAHPQWEKWEGRPDRVKLIESQEISEGVWRTKLFIPRLAGYSTADMFGPSGKGGNAPRRIRFRGPPSETEPVSQWKHAKVIQITDGNELVFDGDKFPEPWSDLQYATEGVRAAPIRYPERPFGIVEELPEWFFLDDPILALPDEERKELREWLEKLSGTRVSAIRLYSELNDVAMMVEVWWDQYRDAEAALRDAARTGSPAATAIASGKKSSVDAAEKEIRRIVKARYQVDIEPKVLVGRQAASLMRKAGVPERTVVLELIEKIEKSSEGVEDRTIRKLGPVPTMGPIEKRLLAYMEMKGVKFDPATFKQVPIIRESAGLFGEGRIRWNADNTIEHPPSYKDRWFKETGTDSECVVRRAVRGLWEMKKRGKFASSDKPHRDMVMRHWLAWLSYIVPCPSAIEQRLEKDLTFLESQDKPFFPRPYNDIMRAKTFRQWYMKATVDKLQDMDQESRVKALESDRDALIKATSDPDIIRGMDQEFELKSDLYADLGIAPSDLSEFEGIAEASLAWELRDKGGAKPNARNILETMPNPVVMLLALFWPV